MVDRSQSLIIRVNDTTMIRRALLLVGVLLMWTSALAVAQSGVQNNAGQPENSDMDCSEVAVVGSPYIPVDSWVYPAVLRLYSLGYVDTVYLGLRPWTRISLSHILDEASDTL